MIDVVFLLLVFFMLAARFGTVFHVPIASATSGLAPYSGPPRLVTVAQTTLLLNGVVVDESSLGQALSNLMQSPEDVILLTASQGVSTQRLIWALDILRTQGFEQVVMVGGDDAL